MISPTDYSIYVKKIMFIMKNKLKLKNNCNTFTKFKYNIRKKFGVLV